MSDKRLSRTEANERADSVVNELGDWLERLELGGTFTIELQSVRLRFMPKSPQTYAWQFLDESGAKWSDASYPPPPVRAEIVKHVRKIMEAAEAQAGLVPDEFVEALEEAECLLGIGRDEDADH